MSTLFGNQRNKPGCVRIRSECKSPAEGGPRLDHVDLVILTIDDRVVANVQVTPAEPQVVEFADPV